jgi:hypothetical protein
MVSRASPKGQQLLVTQAVCLRRHPASDDFVEFLPDASIPQLRKSAIELGPCFVQRHFRDHRAIDGRVALKTGNQIRHLLTQGFTNDRERTPRRLLSHQRQPFKEILRQKFCCRQLDRERRMQRREQTDPAGQRGRRGSWA